MHPHVNLAVRAARAAGSIIMRHLSQVDQLTVTAKQRNDFVTEVDRAAEQEIIRIIGRAHPDHAIVGEESGEHGEGEVTWIIDPLDGTTNYIHGFPQFAVSIGVVERGRVEHGVVYAPFTQELFTASRGAGAQLDGRRIRVSRVRTLQRALIGTGFPNRTSTDGTLDRYMAQFRAVTEHSSGLRRAGAAALDLAFVAAGRLDGFWEMGLKPWDIAAGMLLITEAGGRVADLTGDDVLSSGNIVAGTPKIFSALHELVRDAQPPT